MSRLTKIRILPLAVLQALLLAHIGLVAGIIYSIGGLLVDSLVTLGWVETIETPGLSYGTILAFGALIGMPVIFGAVGFIAGIIEAVLYNLFSGIYGGIEIDLQGDRRDADAG